MIRNKAKKKKQKSTTTTEKNLKQNKQKKKKCYRLKSKKTISIFYLKVCVSI